MMKRSSFLLLILLLPLGVFAQDRVKLGNVLQAGGAVDIVIKGVPMKDQIRVNGRYLVKKDGNIDVPLLHQGIQVEGLTMAQAATQIEKAYRDGGIYTKPRFTLTSKELPGCILIVPPEVAVGGQVKRPGAIRLQKGMTLQEAVDAAGGVTEGGSIQRIELYRKGKRVVYHLGKADDRKVRLQAADSIHVPRKNDPGR